MYIYIYILSQTQGAPPSETMVASITITNTSIIASMIITSITVTITSIITSMIITIIIIIITISSIAITINPCIQRPEDGSELGSTVVRDVCRSSLCRNFQNYAGIEIMQVSRLPNLAYSLCRRYRDLPRSSN